MSLEITNSVITQLAQCRPSTEPIPTPSDEVDSAVHKTKKTDLNPALAKLFNLASTSRKEALRPQGEVKEKKESDHPITFRPLQHRTPGKTKVHIRGKGSGEDAFVTVEYNPAEIPNPLKTPKSKIKLEGINPKILKQAKLVSNAILDEWKTAIFLKKEYKSVNQEYKQALKSSFKYKVKKPKNSKTKVRYKPTEEKTKLRDELADIKRKCTEHPFGNLYGENTTTSMEVFSGVFSKQVNQLAEQGTINTELISDKNFESLVAYLCLRNDKNRGLTSLPHGFFDYSDEDIIERVTTIGRYFTVNELGLNTAEKVEKYTTWSQAVAKAGLQKLNKLISIPELLKLLFPGYLDGGLPPIREEVLPAPNKWQGDESDDDRIWTNAIRACKYAVIDQGIVNPETGEVNTEVLLEKDLGKIFYEPKYCLRGAIGVCYFLTGAMDALDLAIPGVSKIYPKHRFKYANKWTDDTRLKLIDEITKFIVEKKLKLTNESGNLSAEKILSITDWRAQYDDECTGCLYRSGAGNAYEALKRVYPESFGWGENQIKPGELRYGGMWDGEAGIRLFQLRFAKSIYDIFEKLKNAGIKGFENHGAEFFPNIEKPLKLPRKDFIALKNHYTSHGVSWYEHFLAFNLTAGFMTIAKDQNTAFEILLGKPNPKTGCFGSTHIKAEDVIDRNPTRTYLISSLLSDMSSEVSHEKVNIVGLRKHGYGMDRTGIEGSCLEPYLIHRSESIVLEKSHALYLAFASAILSSSTQRRDSKELDRFTALEKILIAENPVQPEKAAKPELMLSDRRLRHFFRFLIEDIIPNVNLKVEQKQQLITVLEGLLKLKKPSNDPREVLLAAAQTDRKYSDSNNPFGILNALIENIFTALAIHEIRYEKANGCNTAHFDRVLGFINVDEEDNTEEVVAENSPEQDTLSQILDEAKKEAEAVIKKTRKIKDGATSVKDVVEAEAAIEAVEAIEALKNDLLANSEWDSALSETVKIFQKLDRENKQIIETLARIANDKTQSRKYFQDFLHYIDEGDLTIQIRLLYQLGQRAKQRSQDRFDYSTLRAKDLPACYIDSIVNDGSHNIEDNLSDDIQIEDLILEDSIDNDLNTPEQIIEQQTSIVTTPLSELDLVISAPTISDSISKEVPVTGSAISDSISEESQVTLQVEEQTIQAETMVPSPTIKEEVTFQLETINDVELIDKDLLKCMPKWWPHKTNKEPLAVPLLYYDNTLHIALSEADKSLEKSIREKLPRFNVEFKVIRADSWFKLLEYYKKHSEVRSFNPERPPINQFILDNEEARLLENITALRKATTSYLKEKNKTPKHGHDNLLSV